MIQPTDPPKAEGIDLLRSILQDIERRQRQDRARRVIVSDPDPAPDEHWFQPLLAGLNSE